MRRFSCKPNVQFWLNLRAFTVYYGNDLYVFEEKLISLYRLVLMTPRTFWKMGHYSISPLL